MTAPSKTVTTGAVNTNIRYCWSESTLVILGWLNNIINFQDHFADLRRQKQLLLFAAESFEDILFPHVIGSDIIAVNPQVWIVLRQLSRLHLCQAFNGLQT